MPLNIQDLLTPRYARERALARAARGLAHLIMGDGFLLAPQQNGVVIICSESFTKEEQELLIAALGSKFGIQAALNKRVSDSGL